MFAPQKEWRGGVARQRCASAFARDEYPSAGWTDYDSDSEPDGGDHNGCKAPSVCDAPVTQLVYTAEVALPAGKGSIESVDK